MRLKATVWKEKRRGRRAECILSPWHCFAVLLRRCFASECNTIERKRERENQQRPHCVRRMEKRGKEGGEKREERERERHDGIPFAWSLFLASQSFSRAHTHTHTHTHTHFHCHPSTTPFSRCLFTPLRKEIDGRERRHPKNAGRTDETDRSLVLCPSALGRTRLQTLHTGDCRCLPPPPLRLCLPKTAGPAAWKENPHRC